MDDNNIVVNVSSRSNQSEQAIGKLSGDRATKIVDLQLKNDLFLSLKLHIDSQFKLNQFNQSRIRSFEKFRKYCQRVVSFGGGDGTEVIFDQEQFQNEYNRFDRNYRYWRKRIRNLKKQTKSSFSTGHQNLYDILYELFAKIESLDQTILNNNLKESKRPEDLSGEQINVKEPTSESANSGARRNKKSVQLKVKQNLKKVKKKLSKPTKVTKVTKPKSLSKKKTLKLESSSDSDSPVPQKRKRGRPKSTNGPRVLSCDVVGCQYSTANSWDLKIHKRSHSDVRPYPCDRCQLAFKIKGDLKRHQNIHEGIRFHCTFEGCTASYSTKRLMRNHIQIFHTKEAPLLYCDWEGCNFSTYRLECLKIHRDIHKEDRPHKCPHCKQAFKSAANLWKHRQKHENEGSFKCNFEGCSYSTYSNELLKIHQVIHTRERPFTCAWPGCGDSFKTASGLRNHKLMHENLRRYKCSWDGCEFAANLAGGLRCHVEAVHEKKKRPRIRKSANNSNKRNLLNSSLEFSTKATDSSTIPPNIRPLVSCNIGPDMAIYNNDNNNNNNSITLQLL